MRSSPFPDRSQQWAAASPITYIPSLITKAEYDYSYCNSFSTTPPKQPDPPPRPLTTAQQATPPQPVLLLRLPPTYRIITTHTIRRWLNSLWLTTISLTKRVPLRLDLQELVYQALGLGPVQVLGPEQERQQTRRLKDIWDLMVNGFIRLNPPRRLRRGRGRRSSGPKEGGSGRIRRCWSGTLVSSVLWSFFVFFSSLPSFPFSFPITRWTDTSQPFFFACFECNSLVQTLRRRPVQRRQRQHAQQRVREVPELL